MPGQLIAHVLRPLARKLDAVLPRTLVFFERVWADRILPHRVPDQVELTSRLVLEPRDAVLARWPLRETNRLP